MKRSLKVGDWVNSYSEGIYRIEKMVENYYEESDDPEIIGEKSIGDSQENKTIISKRLFDSKFKKSISYESCSEFFVSLLDKKQLSRLEKLLVENPKFITELDTYSIPTLRTIYSLNLKVGSEGDLQTILSLVSFIKQGKTFIEIQNEMKRVGVFKLIPRNFGNYQIQLCNFDDEYIEKRRIWRDVKLIEV